MRKQNNAFYFLIRQGVICYSSIGESDRHQVGCGTQNSKFPRNAELKLRKAWKYIWTFYRQSKRNCRWKNGRWKPPSSLIDEGNTIPFISRYRKEATGSLNDEQLRDLHERLQYLRSLEDKKQQVLGSIEEQGKLTEELRTKILEAQTLVAVEDLYRPYRPKRKTRASVAKEKGLEPLAQIILAQEIRTPLEEEAAKYVSEDGVALLRRRCREPWIFWRSRYPTRRNTAAISARPLRRKVLSAARPRTKRPRPCMRCITILRSR